MENNKGRWKPSRVVVLYLRLSSSKLKPHFFSLSAAFLRVRVRLLCGSFLILRIGVFWICLILYSVAGIELWGFIGVVLVLGFYSWVEIGSVGTLGLLIW